MPKKPVTYRLEPLTALKLDAWSLLLKKEKTQIIEEAFSQWEKNRPDTERKKAQNIVDELK